VRPPPVGGRRATRATWSLGTYAAPSAA
jgi:hypothetical protein